MSKNRRRRIVAEEIINNVDIWENNIELTPKEINKLENLQNDPLRCRANEITLPDFGSGESHYSNDEVNV